MKKQISFLLGLASVFAVFFSSCEKNHEILPSNGSILPEKFSVDIPSSISYDWSSKKAGTAIDTLKGNAIYGHLGTFIRVGEHGAELVQDIIKGIARFNINKPMRFSFESDEDGRTKNLVVMEEVNFEGVSWEFQLTITDADSENNEDGGAAMQIFWNRYPRKGVAILKPYNINRNSREQFAEAVFRIDYSEAGERGYDAHMIVAVSGLPLAHPLENPFSMKTIKMFVGKKAEIVDVYGNSDHPHAVFFTPTTGFNWAFVATGNNRSDIGVAEVGLPSSTLDEPSRSVLLDDYSVKNVLSSQIYSLWPFIDDESVEAYLHNTQAPGFFDTNGFIQGGTSPNAGYDALITRLESLSPYNPKEIHNLSISFKMD